jgi:hypothetical protein
MQVLWVGLHLHVHSLLRPAVPALGQIAGSAGTTGHKIRPALNAVQGVAAPYALLLAL